MKPEMITLADVCVATEELVSDCVSGKLQTRCLISLPLLLTTTGETLSLRLLRAGELGSIGLTQSLGSFQLKLKPS